MSEERQFDLVDRQTGEVFDGCPSCADHEDAIRQYEKQIRILNSRITRLERNREDEDRKHKLWPEAEQIYAWWVLSTGHFKAQFSVEDFRHMRPRLKEKDIGAVGLLQAIAGAAYDASERPMANGRIEKYDSIELICREREKTLNFQNRVPGDPEGHEWKRWLIDRIQSNLTNEEDNA